MKQSRGRSLRRARALVIRSLRHPSWGAENVRMARRRHIEAERQVASEDIAKYLVSQESAVTALLGISGADYHAALADTPSFCSKPDEPISSPTIWNATSQLISILSVIVRTTRPKIVVETGVARGYSSAVILATLEELGCGKLHSIDFPALEVDAGTFVGSAVPSELRHRWSLHLGPSRQILPKLMMSLPPVDIFIHDSDHTYDSQMEEYTTVWPYLCSGGILVSDDVGNSAFWEFAKKVGSQPFLVAQSDKAFPIGLLRKDAAQ